MQAAVTLVMMDIVGSRKIQQTFRRRVGDKGNRAYSDEVLTPCRKLITGLLASCGGKIHDDVGDQIAAYFDYAQDALKFSLEFQRALLSSPIAVPEKSGCPYLQMRSAVGVGTMEKESYDKPGAIPVGAFSDLARVLAVALPEQILVTEECIERAGELVAATHHTWRDVTLPKEAGKATLIEILWDGRKRRRPSQRKTTMQSNSDVLDALIDNLVAEGEPVELFALEIDDWEPSFLINGRPTEAEVYARVYDIGFQGPYVAVILERLSEDLDDLENATLHQISQGEDALITDEQILDCLGAFESFEVAKLKTNRWKASGP